MTNISPAYVKQLEEQNEALQEKLAKLEKDTKSPNEAIDASSLGGGQLITSRQIHEILANKVLDMPINKLHYDSNVEIITYSYNKNNVNYQIEIEYYSTEKTKHFFGIEYEKKLKGISIDVRENPTGSALRLSNDRIYNNKKLFKKFVSVIHQFRKIEKNKDEEARKIVANKILDNFV